MLGLPRTPLNCPLLRQIYLLPIALTLFGCAGGGSSAPPVPTHLLQSSAAALAFGNVVDGTTSSLTCTLTNSGNSNVTISDIAISGAEFTVSGAANGTTLTLSPGQSTTLNVTFSPKSGGPASNSAITITSDATNSPLTITLTGTGTHAVDLAWTEQAPTGGITYNVFRGTASGAESTTPLNSSPITSQAYTDTNVAPGATYYYTVEAVDSFGSSGPSSEVSATIPSP